MGKIQAVQFDVDKTELIHFAKTKDAIECQLNMPMGGKVSPAIVVKWLGVWFDRNLSFKHHIKTRVAQAKAAFQGMARLANTERGLSHIAMRQLYLACVTSISDYASPVWWRGQQSFVDLLQGLQNMALRKILGCFKTSPVRPMEIEACLCPPEIRLNHSRRKYAIRSLTLATNHPLNLMMKHNSEESIYEEGINTRENQVKRIRESLIYNPDFVDIEPIKSNFCMPWSARVPYSIDLGNGGKEEEKILHIETLRKAKDSQQINYYTDTSVSLDSKGIGVSLLAYDQKNQSIKSEYCTLSKETNTIYDGELEAIVRAIEHPQKHTWHKKRVTIFSDSKAALERMKDTGSKSGQARVIRAIEAATQLQKHGVKVHLQWVPAHQGIKGNEEAGKLAKAASHCDPDESYPTSLAFIYTQLNKDKCLEWQDMLRKFDEKRQQHDNPSPYSNTYSWQIRKEPWIPRGIKRGISAAFYQLKTGHGYNRWYMQCQISVAVVRNRHPNI